MNYSLCILMNGNILFSFKKSPKTTLLKRSVIVACDVKVTSQMIRPRTVMAMSPI